MEAPSQLELIEAKKMRIGQVFTPGAPVNVRDLFSGRITQLNNIISALSQRGYHAVLFGERGVGKTSLANILVAHLSQYEYLVAKVNCDAGDTFTSIWKKAFKDITYTTPTPGIGYLPQPGKQVTSVAETLPEVIQPDDVRRVLATLSAQRQTLIVLDEYDRIKDLQVATLVSDTIKGLSDFGIGASILLIGVADSIDELVAEHRSIERALVQIPMPRMSNEEIGLILDNGMSHLQMVVDESARQHLITLSQGLPYIAHLLAMHSTRVALAEGLLSVDRKHVDAGINSAIDQWQASIAAAYLHAVKSQQPGNIFREVLLACALAEVDDRGYFTAAAVRSPLCSVVGRSVDIPNFSRHLKEFSEEGRGEILDRDGVSRRFRYRFNNPLMRAYVIIRGYRDRLIS